MTISQQKVDEAVRRLSRMRARVQYDYRNQAWLENGRYIACGHGAECQECFGTAHQGEQPVSSEDIE